MNSLCHLVDGTLWKFWKFPRNCQFWIQIVKDQGLERCWDVTSFYYILNRIALYVFIPIYHILYCVLWLRNICHGRIYTFVIFVECFLTRSPNKTTWLNLAHPGTTIKTPKHKNAARQDFPKNYKFYINFIVVKSWCA